MTLDPGTMRRVGPGRRASAGRTLRVGAVLAAAVGLGGCFSYRSVAGGVPAAGQEVRLELTGAAQDRLRAENGLIMESVVGRTLDASDASVRLRVDLSSARLGFGSGTYADTLAFAREQIRDVQVRTFSGGRTALAGALGVAAVFGAYRLFVAEDSGGEGPPPDPEFIRVPVSSIVERLVSWSLGR